MISLVKDGEYSLVKTKGQTKVLTFDNKKTYSWIHAGNIGEILVSSHKDFKTNNILSIGSYRVYKVKGEPDLTDLLHLELHAGNGVWQGYLLPAGLPTNGKKRSRIIPTDEVISK